MNAEEFFIRDPLPEYINAAGRGEGAIGFLMAMPALAIECVLEGKSWPSCF